jgi:cyclomaltodextrinase / maltogenic alpha-amylase / neopullulanase
MSEIKLGKYRHYKHKDKEYELVGVANHSETLEKLVIYKALYEHEDYPYGSLWARPMEMFMGTVSIDGKEIPRFEYIGE